jgi:uncharacterized glyoxalase superfamily protein PhnB
MNIPKQYLPVMPYVIVDNGRAFITFMKAVFGATEQLIVPAEGGKVMHGELRVYDAVIMFADAGEQWKVKAAGMYIYIPDVMETYAQALAQGAKSLMPPARQEYGFSAGFEDSFGNHWWITEPEAEIK